MQKFLIQMFLLLIFLLSVWAVIFFTLIAADGEAKRYFDNKNMGYYQFKE